MKPSLCSTIRTPRRVRTTRIDFGQDHLDEPRVFTDLGRKRARLGGRLNRGEINDATLGLRDDFLRNDDYIPCAQRNAVPLER